MKTTLNLSQLALSVHLGVTPEEQAQAQTVLMHANIAFSTTPAGCQSDDIVDTICYASLCSHAQEVCDEKTYHLIEHLATRLHAALLALLPANTKLALTVTKNPPIEALPAASFTVSNEVNT